MLGGIFKKVLGTKNQRELKKIYPIVDTINSLESEMKSLSDEKLTGYTDILKKRLADGESLDEVLPAAFAVVREASWRVLGMRHFDVQLIGGVFLHMGRIAEMKTGEGKTLVATLPAYLNALEGKGVHIVTVNDYLASRDSEWMGRIYSFLGLSVGTIVHDMPDDERHTVYLMDITFGTNNEFGFDYLRDNMKFSSDDLCQGGLNYCIIDEVDSILIDEARTPLIISGPSEESTDKYYQIDKVIPALKAEEDYTIDEKVKSVILTEEGNIKVEKLLQLDNLYDLKNIEMVHHVVQGLRAHALFQKDVDYVVKDGEVLIVDEFTGRLMVGRRWSDGLHQAVEAKEGVHIARENQTLATVTFQNYFRMYDKISGMTGTADTEAMEFADIYDLDVMVIPTNQPMIREDNPDQIYRTAKEKDKAIVHEINDRVSGGQPVLVGTISIEKSEMISKMLKAKAVAHSVLNAKYHEKEAEIVAQAGRAGVVTIATNMAGRGTDIVLGGNPEAMLKSYLLCHSDLDKQERASLFEKYKKDCEDNREEVLTAGGLHIIGTERHESRRIDNQLRGRSGRQGDPGSSRFFLSLEDDLMRIFGSDRISGLMQRLGMEEDVPIEHKMVTKAIENAQKKVEGNNFEIRKQLLDYDDVMNKQREVIYAMRRHALHDENLEDEIFAMMEDIIDEFLEVYCPENDYAEAWELDKFKEAMESAFKVSLDDIITNPELDREELRNTAIERGEKSYQSKKTEYSSEMIQQLERVIMLQAIDSLWKEHLLAMDHLKEGIGLRGYGQKDPLSEYKREGFDLFADMIGRIKKSVVEYLMRVQIVQNVTGQQVVPPAGLQRQQQEISMNRGEEQTKTVKREGKKVGRNDPCPCNSGKKYKKCCAAR